MAVSMAMQGNVRNVHHSVMDKSVRNSGQAIVVLRIRLERRGMLNPKQRTIILCQCKHEGTRNAVVVGMQL